MQGILDIIIDEKYEYGKEKLRFSNEGVLLDKLEIVLAAGEIYEGSFVILAPEGRYTYGYVSASDVRMECISGEFAGTEEIRFCFHGEYLESGESCRGEFLIRSNQGEYELPYEVRVPEEVFTVKEGVIANVTQYADMAKNNWQEAVGLFYQPQFETFIREKEPQLYLCYQALSKVRKNEHNVDQFLIAAGKKQRMSYYVEDSLITVEPTEGISEISLGIIRNGWGYTRLDVETEGDFLTVEKDRITDDDFLGNRYKLSLYIDSDKLHGGKNLGRVILWDYDTSVEVPVEVWPKTGVNPDREIRREKGKNHYKLMEIYEAFRLKEMNTADWMQETDQLVQRMMTLDEKDPAAKLFFAQILITAERYSEAGWILEHYRDFGEEYLPELEAYYLYLTSLLRRDETYTRQVADKIERIYKEQGESWRAAWLLLYVSREYERSITGKWLFLEEQFEHGCRSPLIYFEAVQLLNRNPALLRKIERFELQVLYYGNRKGILSPEVLEQMYYLAGRVKVFSGLLYRILENCYEKTQDIRIVKEICTLLIKGNRVEKQYYRWFKLGVQAEIRITNLYEYYMMSLDLETEEDIPKIVLLYFTYQSNLDYAHAAYLYNYVLRKQHEYPEIYESYRSRIAGFVKEQVQRERMNEELDKLYHMFLTEDMVQKQNASAMLGILFSYHMQVPNSLVRKAYVYQKDYEEPHIYPVTEEKIWIPIYGKDSCVVWEDAKGNRFLTAYPLTVTQETASHPIVKRGAVYVENNPFLDLHLYEAEDIVKEANAEWIARLFRLWNNPLVHVGIRREVAVKIMKYYYHTEDKAHLTAFLESLPKELFTRREASEAIKYMVSSRLDDLAYGWMLQYSPVTVDSKIRASLLSSMIKKAGYAAEEHLIKYAHEIFVKGKYTHEILRYLVMHYEGTAHNMYQVWKAAFACEEDVGILSRRLLTQMLFTDTYVQEHGEVFRQYVKDAPEETVVWAYLIRSSNGYYLESRKLDQVVANQILRMAREGQELPVICELACLKYYAENQGLLCEENKENLAGLLKKQLQKGIHLPWFLQYQKGMDKTILEYHATRDTQVKFRFLPLSGGDGDNTWKIVNMRPVCRRVFFTEQVLFFGESLEYQILEEEEGTDVVMKSGILKAGEGSILWENGRFCNINGLLEAAALNQDKQFEMLLEDYLKKDFINERIFQLL